jgi:hypothetical protein
LHLNGSLAACDPVFVQDVVFDAAAPQYGNNTALQFVVKSNCACNLLDCANETVFALGQSDGLNRFAGDPDFGRGVPAALDEMVQFTRILWCQREHVPGVIGPPGRQKSHRSHRSG